MQQANSALANGRSAEEVAREFVPLRNLLKVEARAEGPAWADLYAQVRNLMIYGNRVGPSVEQLVKDNQGDWSAVVQSLGSTNKTIDKWFKP